MTEPKTKSQQALEAVSNRTGACVCCTCEVFEGNGLEDGFAVCVCRHTQWGHNPPGQGRKRNGDTPENQEAKERFVAWRNAREEAAKGVKS